MDQTPCKAGAFAGVDVPDDDLLTNCMHCGFCLPVCPTYAVTGLERSSPRGRIRLIKAVAHGELELSSTFAEEMHFCLNCRACETACPAGVRYGELVEAARAQVHHSPKWTEQTSALGRFVLRNVMPHPRRFKSLARLLRLAQRLRLPELGLHSGMLKLLAPKLAQLVPLQPRIARRFSDETLPLVSPARGTRRCRVGLLTGCVMNVAFADENASTLDVLVRNGCEVVVPRNQPCCGSLHGHLGDLETARALARKTIDTFAAQDVEAVVVNSAGCGSFMKDYGHLLRDDPAYAARAAAFAARVKDVSEFLLALPWQPPAGGLEGVAAYHDACHLAHGQQITQPPRALLAAVPGLVCVDLPESDWCCGSAGVYNLTHPATALALLDRKMEHVRAAGARVLLAANPGCLIQLRYGARRHGLPLEVLHPITLLHRAYAGPDAAAR